MNITKKLLLSLFIALTSFLLIFYRSIFQKPARKITQSTSIYWKKRFHATLATFEGTKENKRLANESLNALKSSSADFEFDLLLGDIDLLTNAHVSTQPVLNTRDGKPLTLENYHQLIKTNPPTHYRPWYMVVKYWDKNKKEVNPYLPITSFFSNLKKIERPFLPHITIATIKAISNPQDFLSTILEANEKFVTYLKQRKKPIKVIFNKENLYLSKSYNDSPRFILSNTIKRSSKTSQSLEKAIRLIREFNKK